MKPTTNSLTLVQFQNLASRTLPISGEQKFFSPKSANPDTFPAYDRNVDLIHACFGITGEAGELLDPVKKAMFYGKPLDIQNIREEAGDLLWYIAGPLCRALGCTLEDLARENVAKLRARYPEKYTDEAAVARADKSQEAGTFPTRAGFRWRAELSSDERVSIIQKLKGADYQDGYFWDEDARAWMPVEELWEPIPLASAAEHHGDEAEAARELDEAIATGQAAGLAVVQHLLYMGAARGKIPVTHAGESFMVEVYRSPSPEPFGG